MSKRKANFPPSSHEATSKKARVEEEQVTDGVFRLVTFDPEKVWWQFINIDPRSDPLTLLFDPESIPDPKAREHMLSLLTDYDDELLVDAFLDSLVNQCSLQQNTLEIAVSKAARAGIQGDWFVGGEGFLSLPSDQVVKINRLAYLYSGTLAERRGRF